MAFANEPCSASMVWLYSAFHVQDYQDSLEFKLGSRRTGYALFLQVANVTYVPAAPQLGSLRVQELRAVVERTSECDDGMPDLCFQSTCLLDLCAHDSVST